MQALCPDLMERFSSGVQWTELMASQLRELHARGVSGGELVATVAALPAFKEVLEAVRVAHEADARQVILSDANTVFIEASLHRG